MRVDVALALVLAPPPDPARDVVVLDVLRATSTIASALASGARGVEPAGTLEQATARARATGALLGGEREGLRPEGFDLGNSPCEYDARCADRELVLSTTNGTQAVLAARGSRRILAGSLLNVEATARALIAGGAQEVLLLCSGSRGQGPSPSF